jgi:hypothetical protein
MRRQEPASETRRSMVSTNSEVRHDGTQMSSCPSVLLSHESGFEKLMTQAVNG